MRNKMSLVVAVAVFAVAGFARYTNAFDEPIPINISLLKWRGSPPVGTLYKLVSKPFTSSPFTLPDCNTSSPIELGGYLTVTMGGDTLTCELLPGEYIPRVAPGWKLIRPACPSGRYRGYKYVNVFYDPVSNPCKVVIIKKGVIKVIAKGVGGLSQSAPPNPNVTVDLRIGNDRYCALATQQHYKETDTLIKIKYQPPPASCPGSPGAAFLDMEAGVLH